MIALHRIATIFRKDLRDAIRDARVLVALLVPLGIGVIYNFTFDDDDTLTIAKIAIYSVDRSELPDDLVAVLGNAVDVRFAVLSSEEQVRQELRDKNADLGLVIPAGFDEAIKRDGHPSLTILQPATRTVGGDFVTAAIEPALRMMAGQTAPASFDVSAAATPSEAETAIDKIGLRNWAILASIVMMIAMIAMLAIPVILAEESEKRTLDALVLVSSYREVVIAKAALGVFYVAVMVPLLLGLTTTKPERVALFAAAVACLSVTLIGAGLLMAGLFKTANQLNTWSGFVLLPVIAPAFLVATPVPDWLRSIAELTPTGAAARLLMNSATSEHVFSNNPVMFAIVVVWGVLFYGLVLWQLSRRQA